MTETTVALVCATDRNYALPTAVMLYSALVHLRPRVAARIYVLEDGLDDEIRERIRRVAKHPGVPVSLHYIAAPVRERGARLMSHVSRTTYARLHIGALLPGDLSRVIYLDSDVLVLSDLASLWAADMSSHALLAVRDCSIPDVLSAESGQVSATLSVSGVPPNAPYFNSGLLLLDLQSWRQRELGGKAMAYLAANNDELRYADQTALNVAANDACGELDVRWNAPVPLLRHPEYMSEHLRESLGSQLHSLRKTARVAHFWGPQKPWNDMVLEPLAWRWWTYCRACGWFTPKDAILEQAWWGVRSVWRLACRVLGHK